MASGGGGNASSPGNAFEARLDTSDGVSDTLVLRRYAGQKIGINGHILNVPSGGLSRLVTDNLISPTGADAGVAGLATTLYYVYVSNALASFSPSSIRLSSQPPTLVGGVKYLGSSGNALNWRFVGWVRLNNTPQFESSVSSRVIVNYYNRLLSNLFICPHYTDDNANTAYAYNNAVWAEIASGLSTVIFIANGEDAVPYDAFCIPQINNVATQIGVGRDGFTSPTEQALGITGTQSVAVGNVYTPSEGVHALSLLSAGAQTVFADLDRQGADHDLFATYLMASLFI